MGGTGGGPEETGAVLVVGGVNANDDGGEKEGENRVCGGSGATSSRGVAPPADAPWRPVVCAEVTRVAYALDADSPGGHARSVNHPAVAARRALSRWGAARSWTGR